MSGQITLWGRSSSSNVQKILWMLDELNIEAERIGADMNFGETNTPEFLNMNPNALVPILQHGDLTLWESHAILNYLAATFGAGTFWHESPVVRAPIDQWAIWGTGMLNITISRVFYATVITPPSKHNVELIAATLADASKLLAVLDGQLAKSQYVAGEEFSIADIITGALMYRWRTMDIDRPDTPNVERWVALLQQRAGYRKWGEYSYESLRRKD